ncbi:hypothetical protein [Rhodopila sp.]|uniref:hypothetical protein n=1 Tax=Rhodopila sp. TaxID=2480087 RepID=UPI003D0B8F66
MQNRVQLAQSLLPAEVTQEGLTIRAATSNFVLAVNLYSFSCSALGRLSNGPIYR